ncbi:Aldo/keto reductase [Plantibacter flavus]|uniref:Diketogulonate reductase-like aldo/keto reductase n=1 Tax=Plantibacter flavus TaxID=150123 RepID=A0A3N2C3W2_9MICO|nr:aldo/keto reductase [Plantibacter flavus]ROR82217.1 diketogulonate reductase-like aldo/keto reductase [Plantibacter flavus]SMG42490.1 Aldo/keto reductase [Plantibacter flavus]
MTTIPTFALNDGSSVPAIGFGTYPLRGREGTDATLSAIDAGYRLLDTAVNYRNEDAVGAAVRETGVPRDELVVATKLPGRDHGFEETITSCRGSLASLGLDHIDLYLIHWPNPSVGRFVESWKAMIQLQREGLVRSIGVSNFTEEFLTRLADETGVLPAVNQVELHPYFPQEELLAFHREHGIVTEAWSPLGKAQAPFAEEPVAAAATAHDVSPAQVVLRWHHQRGVLPIPKSASPERQRTNIDVFGFELSDTEVRAITALGRTDGRLFDGDPNTHEEM